MKKGHVCKTIPDLIRVQELRIINNKYLTMRRNTLGYWEDKKERLLRKYKNLTHKDLWFSFGREDEMIETLSHKLGKTRQELLSLIVML